jgi:hypothetical protein
MNTILQALTASCGANAYKIILTIILINVKNRGAGTQPDPQNFLTTKPTKSRKFQVQSPVFSSFDFAVPLFLPKKVQPFFI